MPARLVPLNGGSPIKLDKPIVLIGRHPECDAVLQKSTKVSRRHCCVALVNNRFLIRDLGSMNGIRVNGDRVTECELQPGDQIAIGDQVFSLKQEEAADKREVETPAPGRVGVRMKLPPQLEESDDDHPIALPSDSEPEPALSDSGYLGNSEDMPLRD